MGTAIALIVLLAAAQSPAAPQTPPATPAAAADQRSSDPRSPVPDPAPPVSLERVREGLQRPTLKIPPLEPAIPVFRGSVEVDLVLDTPLQAMRRELAAESGYSGRGPDIIGAVMGIVKRIKAARRAHAEAEIRKEVQAELDVFCAEHDCSVLEDGPPPIEGVILPRRRPAQ